MSPDRLEGKIRNAIRIVEEEVSHGFAILLHLQVMETQKFHDGVAAMSCQLDFVARCLS